jgi:hypothetical protein
VKRGKKKKRKRTSETGGYIGHGGVVVSAVEAVTTVS